MNMRGFTYIEMLITAAVVIVLASIVLGGVSSLRESTNLNRSVDIVFKAIKVARARTLNSLNASSYGVHFASSTATLFKGTVYNPSDANNEVTNLPELTEIINVGLSSSSLDVYFQRLTGEASNNGDITIRSTRNVAKSRKIQIYDSGIIEIKQ